MSVELGWRDDALTDPLLAAGAELSVIVPTRNEALNVAPLVERLRDVLHGIAWEVIFVDDDSTDGTGAAVRALARLDRRVRLVHRIGRRGLSSACIEGIQASTAPFIAVMDGDLQHDERLLPQMLETLKREPLDLVVGSRYVAGGGIGEWDDRRAKASDIATRLGKLILRVPIADPMSGFFMLTRESFDSAVRRLSAISFKILVDLLASAPTPLRLKELPYTFRIRHAGTSKLDAHVVIEYLMLLADKLVGRYVPVRFLMFSIVGGIGLVLHMTILGVALQLEVAFGIAQALATGTAMIGNFALNNWLTYSDRRLRGPAFFRGLLSFCVVCMVGAIANVGIASFLFDSQHSNWFVAGVAGAAMGSVWNYAVSSVVTWKRA